MDKTSEINRQKYENYKEQFKRLNQAMTNGFHLEAMFIEYAIMEDRTESILRHAELWNAYMKSRKQHAPNIDSKIRYIKNMPKTKKMNCTNIFLMTCLNRFLRGKRSEIG